MTALSRERPCHEIPDPALVHIVTAASIPNLNWLRPGMPGAGQQSFGDQLLGAHPLVLMPSVVSTHSWNLLIDANATSGIFKLRKSEAFALDPRRPAA